MNGTWQRQDLDGNRFLTIDDRAAVISQKLATIEISILQLNSININMQILLYALFFFGVFEMVADRESSNQYSIFPKCDLIFFLKC